MEIIERLYNYLTHKGISAYEFEKTCSLSNGYLNNRKGGSMGIGSEILEKIYKNYTDLNLIWLITGDGNMINPPVNDTDQGSSKPRNEQSSQAHSQAHSQAQNKKLEKNANGTPNKISDPLSHEFIIEILQSQIAVLNATVADKSRIIEMMQEKLNSGKKASK